MDRASATEYHLRHHYHRRGRRRRSGHSQSLTVTTAQVASEQVAVVDLRLVDVGPTHVEAAYDSNVCANGPLIVTAVDGNEVGRNDGLASGCGTEHLTMPGVWTPELEPETTYVLTVTLETNGAGLGNGNLASESIEFLTAPAENHRSSRLVPQNP